MSDAPADETLGLAELAFLDYVRTARGDPSLDFDGFCRERPELAEELRLLHGARRVIARLAREAHEDESVAERLKREFGGGDPIERDPEEEQARLAMSNLLSELHIVEAGDNTRYETRGEIARGGMGTIFRVRDLNLRRDLAMKVIGGRGSRQGGNLTGRSEARALHRFLEEAQVTGQLVHPGIVPVHELGIDSTGRPYFTMQLVRGMSFDAVIELARRGAQGWTEARALRVLFKVCEAMAYAHAKGVIHRDLKPTNIMVGRFGETYVMDWGLARVAGREDTKDIRIQEPPITSTVIHTDRSALHQKSPDSPLVTKDGQVIGTPSYMSPEQAAGRIAEVGPHTDIYAVGAMLYHLLTGHPPYLAKGSNLGPYTVLRLLLSGPPPSVMDVNPHAHRELAEICHKAMARRRGDRYATMLDMAQDVDAYLDNRPISPRKHSLPYLLKLMVQRNRRVALTATAAFALIIALVVADLVNVRDARDRAQASQRATARLLDFTSAELLVEREKELHPAVPRMIRPMQEWLDEVGDRLQRLGVYEAELHPTAGDGDADERLRAATAHMRTLALLRPRVAERLRTAETLRRRSIVEQQRAWTAARRSIASHGTYGGLEISPQLGLVPLRQNAGGLWEFWHVLSGARPTVDPASGRYHLTPESGIVLVLLPGGSFQMGSPPDERSRVANEELHDVAVEPFFCAKFEVTQAQWRRVMGANPSLFRADRVAPEPVPILHLHPVETVSWPDADTFAQRLALRLLSEPEWEYACRAGTQTAYHWGDAPACLRDRANVLDLSHDPGAPQRDGADWHDGHAYHAPVGRYEPNGFGLFDMHGNVSEWCSDLYRSATPLDDRPWRRVVRGGSWYLPLWAARAAFRQYDHPSGLNQNRGLRVARTLDR